MKTIEGWLFHQLTHIKAQKTFISSIVPNNACKLMWVHAVRKLESLFNARAFRQTFNVCILLSVQIFCASLPANAAISYQQRADELLPVDCLLPGAVRKLGNQLTYVTQRRPIKTTGVDCEIRGGEYVLYDRANYQTAMSIWLPMAESGDPKAQNFVGEIYEKGLGVKPDYKLAAQWYSKAAEQNYNAAQINLGQLYERGLGVELSQEKALAWYRKSSNIKGKLLKFVSYDYSDEKIAAMEQELQSSRSQLSAQQGKIQRLASQLDSANSKRRAAEKQLASNQVKLDADRAALEEQQTQLASYEQEVAQLKTEMKQQLLAQEQEIAAAKAEAEGNKGFKLPDIVIKFDKRKLAKLKKQLASSQKKLDKLSGAIVEQESQLSAQELALKKKDLQLAEASSDYNKLQRELSKTKTELGSALASANTSKLAAGSAPEIQIIEPPLLATRGSDYVIKTRSGLDQRTVIGQVKSANKLLEVMVNGEVARVDSKGLFQHRVPLTRSITDVEIVAIDTEGLRASKAFRLELESSEQNFYADGGVNQKKQASPKIPKINFGGYHALVIGNSEYAGLPDLDTTIADANAVSDVLETRYGFEVTKLINATRYDILSALNELRGKLTDEDNLLIYYAGHGELDEVNNRGHWLPVDAEEGSTANWISNIAITDILNAMSVRKVLVVADSCYSGSMTRNTLARLDAGRSEGAWKNWLKMVSKEKSRLAFSSGGLAPVLDGGGGKHSIFAKAFLDSLESNNTVLEGRQLHTNVARAVSYAAASAQFEQAPQYAPIRFAGHEAGDFLFVPRKL